MTIGNIDDQLHAHPKPEAAGLEAMGLWALAVSYCCAYLTDGRVTRDRVERIGGKRGLVLAAKLCSARLWHQLDEVCKNPACDKYRATGDGWRFHDWEDHQDTRAEVEAERARKQEAGRRGGFAKARATAATVAAALAPAMAPATASAVADGTAEIPPPALARGISLLPSGSSSSGSGSSQDPLAALPSESTARATEQLVLSGEPEPVSPAEQVFAVYLAGWREHIGKGTEPVFDERRRALVKARLCAFGLEDLKGAAAGVWRSKWHRDERRTAFDLVMRDSAHVEQFRDMPEGGEAPAVRRELQQPGLVPTYTPAQGLSPADACNPEIPQQ